MGIKVVLDTSALVEYFDSTEKGAVVKEIIENRENFILVPAIVVAEISSKLERRGFEARQFASSLEAFTIFLDLDSVTSVNAGKRHAQLRKLEPNISLVDCIVMQIAADHDNALSLTTDHGFKHYKNSKIL